MGLCPTKAYSSHRPSGAHAPIHPRTSSRASKDSTTSSSPSSPRGDSPICPDPHRPSSPLVNPHDPAVCAWVTLVRSEPRAACIPVAFASARYLSIGTDAILPPAISIAFCFASRALRRCAVAMHGTEPGDGPISRRCCFRAAHPRVDGTAFFGSQAQARDHRQGCCSYARSLKVISVSVLQTRPLESTTVLSTFHR
ncbi:hypothetical protein DFH09DRAFT_1158923 [Mycena vulgaris]|nr:hypothetical protein DFH09DRAFT_1158923 [Mycena vulgaris]